MSATHSGVGAPPLAFDAYRSHFLDIVPLRVDDASRDGFGSSGVDAIVIAGVEM